MVYTGVVRNGVVVLDQAQAPPEGARVCVVVRRGSAAGKEGEEVKDVPQEIRDLRETLLKYAGKAQGLPPDMARNHDHYLYGVPKRTDE